MESKRNLEMMKFCLYVPPFGPFANAKILAELARDAESAGWHGFFIWDHIGGERYPETIVDPWVALAAIAFNTKNIKIGALVTPLARRRPWKVARETVSIDHLSQGRLVFGVGTGSGQGEFDHLGEESDPFKRGQMLDEGLDILTGLWSGELQNYHGRYYHVQDTLFLPKPYQNPRIPIWVAGIWPHKPPFRRAARWDGMFPLFRDSTQNNLDEFKKIIDYVKSYRIVDKPFDILFRGTDLPLNDTARTEEIIEPYARLGVTWWQVNLNPTNFGGDLKGDWPVGLMRERIIQGPPKILL